MGEQWHRSNRARETILCGQTVKVEKEDHCHVCPAVCPEHLRGRSSRSSGISMRIAVISDIHSNLEAFEAVLEDIDRSGVDGIVSLGDNIGYGPDPEAVLRLMEARGIPSVMGNHELGIAEPSRLEWFNPSSRESLIINRNLLSDRSRESIKRMTSSLILGGCLFVHGFPPDSVTTYLFEVPELELEATLRSIKETVCFVGHTHELELIELDHAGYRREPLRKGVVEMAKEGKYLINNGSVGQPRDGSPSAKYIILDDTPRHLDVRYVPYDVEKTIKKILKLGLPGVNADRLR